jgi:hypothetical protein
MSYRKRELTLSASPQEVLKACKRAAAEMGWRLAHESPLQLYFVEPHFSLTGHWHTRLRHRWWLYTRLETTIRLEPDESGTRARCEWLRYGLCWLQARQVERDLAAFLDRLVTILGHVGNCKVPGDGAPRLSAQTLDDGDVIV